MMREEKENERKQHRGGEEVEEWIWIWLNINWPTTLSLRDKKKDEEKIKEKLKEIDKDEKTMKG